MTLLELFAPFQIPRRPTADLEKIEVASVCFDSRQLKPNCVFVAIRGEKVDGHHYVSEAVAKGAIGLVVEDETNVPKSFKGAVYVTPDSRVALNKLAAQFFGQPARKLFCVGVTGTNGKTTTTYIIEAILNYGGMPTGVIGTINHHFKGEIWKTEMTTPDPIEFQRRLKDFVDRGAQAVALEVSSHALSQARVDEVDFNVAVFTNLTRDHLDYHKDMNGYFGAKLRLFKDLLARSTKVRRTAVINVDDEYGRRIQAPANVSVLWYGSLMSAGLRYDVIERGFGGTRFLLKTPQGKQEFKILMPGLHNVANATAAIGVGLASGLTLQQCSDALVTFIGVPGRLEPIPNNRDLHIFVDYAHTDDALRTVLHYLSEIRRSAKLKNKIITVFGCGGDRDKGKRPLMMTAAVEGSDFVVATSDNPRTEDPESILDDAFRRLNPAHIGVKVLREADRRKGIAKAIALAKPGDVVLIAGKGHEDYQQIGTTKFPFSDVEVVKEILS